jgi:hypothetical protein
VLRLAACGSRSPKSKRGGLHFGSHELDDLAWSETELSLNGIESGSILPGHLNNTIDISSCQ